MGINSEHIATAPYYPESNGLADRSIQIFKEAMRTYLDFLHPDETANSQHIQGEQKAHQISIS